MSSGFLLPEISQCRCTTIPYFDDEFTVDEQRVMRNQDGKSVLADDMSYSEYRERYLNNDFSNAAKDDIIINNAVGAASRAYNIQLPDGRDAKLAGGTKITKIKAFAGKGTDTDIRVAKSLEDKYGYPAKEWEKVRGEGVVRDEGKNKRAELHWYEAKGNRYEMKVKRWFDDES